MIFKALFEIRRAGLMTWFNLLALMSANMATEATTAAAQLKRKLDPYRAFVRKVLERTAMTPAEARRREGESLEGMLDRVVAAVDETIEKAKKVKKTAPGPPRLSDRPVIWNRADGRLYPDTYSGNYHPDFWTQDFPSRAYPLKCGLEVMLPRMRVVAIIAGFNDSMPQNKVMMILKSAAQMPLDYRVQPDEIRSFTIRGVIQNLVHLRDRIPASAPARAPAPTPAPAAKEGDLGYESGGEL